MTFGELKCEIARLKKNDWVGDNTEVLVKNDSGYNSAIDDVFSYLDEGWNNALDKVEDFIGE